MIKQFTLQIKERIYTMIQYHKDDSTTIRIEHGPFIYYESNKPTK